MEYPVSKIYKMTLTTDRTISTPLNKVDFKSLIEMYLEPDSNKYVAPLKDKSKKFYTDFLYTKLLQNEKSIGFWVVRNIKTNEIIGTTNLNFFAPINGYHIGCHLKTANWNNGFATELLLNLMKYGMKEKSLKNILGIVDKDNFVSKRLLNRIGMHYHSDKEILGSSLEIYSI